MLASTKWPSSASRSLWILISLLLLLLWFIVIQQIEILVDFAVLIQRLQIGNRCAGLGFRPRPADPRVLSEQRDAS